MNERIYGQWAGDRTGTKEDPKRCIEEVWPQSVSWTPYQCSRKRGYGTRGMYCKQHAKKHREKKP